MDSQLQLLCPNCQQQYNNNNLPRMLTLCGHTFCQQCIKKQMKTGDDQKIYLQCPQDDKIINLKQKNLILFPKNIALIRLIDNKRLTDINLFNNKQQDVSFDVSKIIKQEEYTQDDITKQLFVQNIPQNIISGIYHNSPEIQKYQECSTFQANDFSKYPQNHQIIQFPEICLLHQKPLDIVCIKDLQKICANCAIFGQHKGHDCKTVEDISKEQNQYCNQIQRADKRISDQKNQTEILEVLKKKNQKMTKQIKIHYKKLKEIIEKAEEKSLSEMNKIVQNTTLKIKQLLKINPKILDKYTNWEVQSLQIIKILQSHHYQDSLTVLLDNQTKGKPFLKRGNKIIEDIVQQEKQLVFQIQKLLDGIGFNHSNKITDFIDSFIQPFEKQIQKKIQKESFQVSEFKTSSIDKIQKNSFDSKNQNFVSYHNECQDSLLEDICDNQQIKSENSSKIQFAKQSQASIDLNINIQCLPSGHTFLKQLKSQSSFTGKAEKAVNSKKVQEKIENQNFERGTPKKNTRISQASSVSRNPCDESFMTSYNQTQRSKEKIKKRKTIKIVVPQKYQKIIQGIKANNLQIVDFTNAQLGDAMIIGISQMIKATKAKTVKFIRNKLTDDCIQKILPFLSQINTLNLSQNSLSQTTLDLLISFFQNQKPNIKTVILSQNKIIQRKHKNKLQKLRKMNITVSV